MNHTALLASLRSKIGNPTTADVPDGTLTGYLNEAYRHITMRYRHKVVRATNQFNTVAGTATYTLAGQYLIVLQVWDRTHNVKLVKIDPEARTQLDLSVSNPTQRGWPQYYETKQNGIVLYPTPDDAYAIEAEYKANPADLSAGGDTPVINDLWHPGIVMLARWYYWDAKIDAPKATYAYNTWKLWLSDIMADVDEENVDREQFSVRVPGLSDFGATRRTPNTF